MPKGPVHCKLCGSKPKQVFMDEDISLYCAGCLKREVYLETRFVRDYADAVKTWNAAMGAKP
jgi:hypothetical protein